MANQTDSVVYIDPNDTVKTAQAIEIEIRNFQDNARLVKIKANGADTLIFTWEEKIMVT